MPPHAPNPLNATPPDAKADAMRFVLAQKAKPKKPRGFFSQVSRKTILLLLAVSAMSLPVRSDQVPVTPAPAPVTQLMAQTQTIAQLEADFGRTPLGRQLLGFMHEKGIAIVYEPDQPDSYAAFQPDQNRIIIRPNLSAEEQVIYLAHEVRHGWQQHELHYGSMEARHLSPEQRFTLRRFLEADARAFSTYFTADRHQRLGLENVNFGTAQRERQIVTILRREFSSADGLTPAEYRVEAVENAFGFLNGYNPRHLDTVTRKMENFSARIERADDTHDTMRIRENLLSLRRDFNNAPSAHEFEVYLRHFGGTSFNVKAPTSLNNPAVSLQTLTYTYSRRANNDATGINANATGINANATGINANATGINANATGINANAIDTVLTPLTAQYNAQSRRIDEMQANNDALIVRQRFEAARFAQRLAGRLP